MTAVESLTVCDDVVREIDGGWGAVGHSAVHLRALAARVVHVQPQIDATALGHLAKVEIRPCSARAFRVRNRVRKRPQVLERETICAAQTQKCLCGLPVSVVQASIAPGTEAFRAALSSHTAAVI